MRLRTKLLVILAFGARLPVIAIAGVRLYYLDQRLRGVTFTFDYVVATQWQMGYAIMSSTITGMAPFSSLSIRSMCLVRISTMDQDIARVVGRQG